MTAPTGTSPDERHSEAASIAARMNHSSSLAEPVVGDPKVVRDLVGNGVRDETSQPPLVSTRGPLDGLAKQRDAVRQDAAIAAAAPGLRDPFEEPEQSGPPGRGAIFDDHGHVL